MARKTLSPSPGCRRRSPHAPRGRSKRLSETAQRRAWRREVNYFESIRNRLFRDPKYRGKFIAVRGMEIVGVGVDRFQLHRQMAAKYPGEVVLIEQAEKEMQKINLPSVEILR